MDITAESHVPFPRDTVFSVYRDKMAELLPFLANVKKIEVVSRQEAGAVTKLVNIWHGGGDIPAAVRAVVSESMLTWTDRATWDSAAHTCAWLIEPNAFKDAIECNGVNTFYEEGEGDRRTTRIEMRGVIRIDAKKIKGVPGFLAGGVGRGVEEFLKSKVQPNFVEVSAAIAQHLREAPSAKS